MRTEAVLTFVAFICEKNDVKNCLSSHLQLYSDNDAFARLAASQRCARRFLHDLRCQDEKCAR